jgi:hypothetical protein
MGGTWDPKTLTVVLKTNYGVDVVTNDVYSSKITTSTPDKLHVGYGSFLDMNFDVNGSNDANSVFKNSAIKNVGAAGVSSFTYDAFKNSGLTVTVDTKPLGGFMCSTCAAGLQPDAGDVDWVQTGNPATKSPAWKFYLTGGKNLAGNVAPSIVYRIAQDFGHAYVNPGVVDPPYELQRNGVRIAGGDPGMEVYNLKVVDESTPNKRRFSIRIDYQVKLSGSKDENTLHGTAKRTWHKGYVTLKADPRVIVLSGG